MVADGKFRLGICQSIFIFNIARWSKYCCSKLLFKFNVLKKAIMPP